MVRLIDKLYLTFRRRSKKKVDSTNDSEEVDRCFKLAEESEVTQMSYEYY